MARRDGLMELDCAPTVHESNVFMPARDSFKRKSRFPDLLETSLVKLRAEEGAVGVEFGAPKAGALLARDYNKGVVKTTMNGGKTQF
jgi:hypothetical protein